MQDLESVSQLLMQDLKSVLESPDFLANVAVLVLKVMKCNPKVSSHRVIEMADFEISSFVALNRQHKKLASGLL